MAAAKAKAKAHTPAQDEQVHIPFAAETGRVLQLMIHSLYTNKDIFLRELISNASDACDKLRYLALTEEGLMGDEPLCIMLHVDEKTNTLTISDNGIGMNRDDLVANLGTIARSGTLEFMSQLSGDSKKDASLIGQFGVGFYSAFMVADRVVVTSRRAGEASSWRWESDGVSGYSVEELPAELEHTRGTTIVLYLKDEAKTYTDKFKIAYIVETYSDHISFPIMQTNEEGEPDILNTASALWTRPASDVTPEQYREFYHHVAHSPEEPWLTLHNKAEGAVSYTNLLYIPAMKPFDLFHPERRRRVKLYVKRVFITDENVDIIPHNLRFLRGIIDSEDLPLNISRETLQDNPVMKKIREAITAKVLNELKKKAKNDVEGYTKFWGDFGAVLKEGLCDTMSDKERQRLLDCCRFYSTHDANALVSMED
jgi:molecular chaperone HtpG